jgi:anti-anti-sigma factor
MKKPEYRHMQSRVEAGVLVILVTETSIQDEKLALSLQDELLSAVNDSGLSKVVVDLQKVRYLSSVAFRPLLRLRRHLQDSGGRLILCGLSQIVGDVFYTTRLVSADGSFVAPFELEADVTAAVARLTTGAVRKTLPKD